MKKESVEIVFEFLEADCLRVQLYAMNTDKVHPHTACHEWISNVKTLEGYKIINP